MTASTIEGKGERGPGYAIWGASCLVIAVVGFWPSYIARSIAGEFSSVASTMPWHVLSTSLWMLLMISQPALIQFGKVGLHRLVGLAGAGVAIALVLTGFVVQIEVMGPYAARGDAGNAVLIPFFRLVTLVVFAVCVAVAIACRARSAWHKRLMLLGTFSLLEAPMARIFANIVGLVEQSGPLAAITHVVLMVLFVAWDRRAHGKLHPVAVWGTGLSTLVVFGTAPIAFSEWWRTLAGRLAGGS